MGIKQGDKWAFKHLYRGVFFLLLTIYVVLFLWAESIQGKDVYAGLGQLFGMHLIAGISTLFIPIGIIHMTMLAKKDILISSSAISALLFSALAVCHFLWAFVYA